MYIILKKKSDTDNYQALCDPSSSEILEFETIDEAEACCKELGFYGDETITIADRNNLEK